METLIIEPTENTPRIILDPATNVYEFSGQSRPENVKDFYEPILDWLTGLCEEFAALLNKGSYPFQFDFKFDFEYFNTSSSKFILELMKKIKYFNTLGANVQIYWYYDEGDDDMQKVGEEMSKVIKLPFIFIDKIE